MKFYKSGERSKAVCESCADIVATTFAYRDVPFSDDSGSVPNLLVAVCDRCGDVVAIPAQSTPSIRNARETASKPIEVNLPAPYMEVLDYATYIIDPMVTTEFRKHLLVYYIRRTASREDGPSTIGSLFKRKSVQFTTNGVPKRRLSFKVTPRLNNDLNLIMESAGLRRTDVIKGLVIQIKNEIVEPKRPRHLAELQRLAVVICG